MSPALTRRGFVKGGTVALGASVLGMPITAWATASAVPVTFDPAAFLADLTAAGYGVSAYQDASCDGLAALPLSYIIRPPPDRGFGAAYTAVMAQWANAMGACPDHVEHVVAYVFERSRAAFGQVTS